MPRQLYLPGMGPAVDGGEASPLPDDDASICMEPAGATACTQPRCPNCGGTAFDGDGDCTRCWEPGVVLPAGGRSRTRQS